MDISKYAPQLPPKHIRDVMNDLVIMQKYRDFTYSKPLLGNPISLEKPTLSYHATERQIIPTLTDQTKTKIIHKVRKHQMDVRRQKKSLKVFNLYLLQNLNLSAMESVGRKEPLPMSVLDSKDEGDYLPDGDKKDHLHYSNTIKLTQIPHQKNHSFVPQVKKKSHTYFEQDDICVLKVKQFRKFISCLFRMGNEEFDSIGQKIGLNTSTTKLLYDLSNDYFRVENSLDIKSHEVKKKVGKKIIKFAQKAFEKYKNRQNVESSYVPLDEQFVSLRDIRSCFTAALDEVSSSQSQS